MIAAIKHLPDLWMQFWIIHYSFSWMMCSKTESQCITSEISTARWNASEINITWEISSIITIIQDFYITLITFHRFKLLWRLHWQRLEFRLCITEMSKISMEDLIQDAESHCGQLITIHRPILISFWRLLFRPDRSSRFGIMIWLRDMCWIMCIAFREAMCLWQRLIRRILSILMLHILRIRMDRLFVMCSIPLVIAFR